MPRSPPARSAATASQRPCAGIETLMVSLSVFLRGQLTVCRRSPTTPVRGELPTTFVCGTFRGTDHILLRASGRSERVARERAARMGATLRRLSESGAKTPEEFRALSDRRASSKPRAKPPRQRAAERRRANSKGNYQPAPVFLCARGKGARGKAPAPAPEKWRGGAGA